MVEFIVLGQIPGTDIYLSFTTIAVLALIVGGPLFWLTQRRVIFKQRQQKIEAKAL